MPQFVEDIVDAHMAARRRRSQGLSAWAQRVPVQKVVREAQGVDVTGESSIATAREIGLLLRTHLPVSWFDIGNEDYDDELVELTEEFESFEPRMFGSVTSESDIIEHLDTKLDELYDWADRERVSLFS